ncbi:MAG TPA: DUF3299 domain-containing protein, partial [Verrucomicrobiae bacterium]|nr:DUF3299 domain-containing protein [Verrucomicrobiae bacterium]
MRLKYRHIFLVCWHGLLVLALTACGPSKDVSDKPAQIHGELIAPSPGPQPKITAVAVAANPQPAPIPSLVAAVPVAPKPTTALDALASPQSAPPPEVRENVSNAPEYAAVGFDKLASYNFEVDDRPLTNSTTGADKANNQIPDRVKALDQKKVSIRGFMLPLKVSNGVVTEFLIMKDQSMCCYGTVPKITEWVSVKTPEHGVKSIMDQPVIIEGTLHVGAMRENGYLIGIYQMDGDKLIAPE